SCSAGMCSPWETQVRGRAGATKDRGRAGAAHERGRASASQSRPRAGAGQDRGRGGACQMSVPPGTKTGALDQSRENSIQNQDRSAGVRQGTKRPTTADGLTCGGAGGTSAVAGKTTAPGGTCQAANRPTTACGLVSACGTPVSVPAFPHVASTAARGVV